jgi:hypothetical protein
MNDVFKEQLVKKASTTKDTLIRVGLVVVLVLIFLISTMIIPGISFMLTAAAAFGAYYLMSMLKVEYEYLFTNGELDIDAIYNKTRRKRLFTGDVRNFEVMAHIDDKMHTGDFTSAAETKDYGSGVTGNNTYAFLASYKGKTQKIIFEPNEMMMQAISTMLTPRKLFKRV